MAERLLLILALRDGVPIAGALNLIGAEALYGRYWGAIEEVPHLHFELCYYQAIEARDRARPQAGRGGRAGRAQAGARLPAGADLLGPLYRRSAAPGGGGGLSRRRAPRGRARDRRARRNDPVPQGLRRAYDRALPRRERGGRCGRFLVGVCMLALDCRRRRRPRRRPAPERHFTARDLFGLEAAADPEISPDGRWIAYVRRSGDIMTDRFRPVDLADRHAQRRADAARRRHRIAQPAALVARRRPARLYLDRRGRAAAIVRALDGERRGGRGSPACPTRRAASPGRPTAARSPIRCSCPTRAQRLGAPQTRPEGAHLGRAAADHHRGHLPRRRPGLYAARLRPDLPGLGRRRRAAPAELRPL